MSGHVVPKKIYFMVFTTLLVLTALTTAAGYVDMDKALGLTAFPMNTVVALVIAICKASLVILFFMHVRYSSNLTKIVVVAGLFWLAILIALTFSDYGTRNLYIPNPPAAWDTSLPQVSR